MKPKHQGGYSDAHADLCERTLVTLLRGLGPWKAGVYLVGGLVPRYLIPRMEGGADVTPPHAGTTDVDLVLDLQVLAEIEAYQRLEQNLKAAGFVRGSNEEGEAQHFSWRKPIGEGLTVIVDLLRDSGTGQGGRATTIPGEKGLSALGIPGAHLVADDPLEVEITAELLDARGVASETVRVANIAPFIILKALAFDDRAEEKDAYDLIYCLMYYGDGPEDVARQFVAARRRSPEDPYFEKALDILSRRFTSDGRTPGYKKDGPTGYARFLSDPGRSDLNTRRRRDASAVVEQFLHAVEAHGQS